MNLQMIHMRRTESNPKYFSWLKDKIHAKEYKGYGPILRRLMSRSFYSLIDFDDNRALDGLGYRHTYKNETGAEPPGGDCTVLEVLIALAERMAYQLYDPKNRYDDQTYIWFWHMLNNLHIDPDHDVLDNMHKIDVWLERKFTENGDGSPFPLRESVTDQRETELWYQMQAYINEILYDL